MLNYHRVTTTWNQDLGSIGAHQIRQIQRKMLLCRKNGGDTIHIHTGFQFQTTSSRYQTVCNILCNVGMLVWYLDINIYNDMSTHISVLKPSWYVYICISVHTHMCTYIHVYIHACMHATNQPASQPASQPSYLRACKCTHKVNVEA